MIPPGPRDSTWMSAPSPEPTAGAGRTGAGGRDAGPPPAAPPHRRIPAVLSPWLQGLALVLIGLYLVAFYAGNVHLQWDLATYLAAARTALAGANPYDPVQVAAVAGHPIAFPFVYPPIALLPFLALAVLPAPAVLWLALKLALIAGLVLLWRFAFLPRTGWLPLAAIALFGWNGAALWDLRAGNVATLETALLWSAFACFATERRTAFAALVVAAACFKLLPAAFLLLLLVPVGLRGAEPRRLGFALVLLGLLVLGAYATGPARTWGGFLARVPAATIAGEANPGALSAFATAATLAGRHAVEAARLAWIGYAVYALALLAASAPHLARIWRTRRAADWVMSAAFLYVLLSPRPMAYGFMLLAPAPLYFRPRPFDGAAGPLLLVLVLCAQGFMRIARVPAQSYVAVYSPLLLTLALWLLIVSGREPSGRAAPSVPAPA